MTASKKLVIAGHRCEAEPNRSFETLGSRLAPQDEVLVLRSARSARLEARLLTSFAGAAPQMTNIIQPTTGAA
jgi:hypothetical protein